MIERIERIGDRWWGLLLLIAVPIFLLFIPYLFSFRILSDGFAYTWLQQFFHFYQHSITEGVSPLWNPYVFSGFPSFVSLTGGFFSPVAYLFFRLFSVSFAYHALIFIHLVFGGFFMALFIRRFGVGFLGAYMGGIAFVFSQWLLIPDMPLANGILYLPLLFFLTFEAWSGKWVRATFWGVVAIGLAWFTVHWHYLVEILFAVGMFVLYLSCIDSNVRLSRFRAHTTSFYVKPIVSYLTMVVGGTLMGLVQLVPTYLYIGLSARSQGFSHWSASSGGFMPGDFLTFFLPHFNVPTINSAPWIFYIGIMPLFFFLIGLGRRSWNGFFTFLFSASLLLSINYSPLFWLLHHLPFMNLLHSPTRWIIISVFAMAVLSALGIEEYFSERTWLPRHERVYKILMTASTILASSSLLFGVLIAFFEDRILAYSKALFVMYAYEGKSLPLEEYFQYIDIMYSYFKESFYFFSPKVSIPLCISIVTLLFLKHSRIWEATQLRYVFFFILLSSPVLVFSVSDSSSPFNLSTRTSESASFIRTRGEGRVLPLFSALAFTGNETRNDILRLSQDLFLPNINTAYRIPSAEYLDEIRSQRMTRILGVFKVIAVTDPAAFHNYLPLLDFLGVKFVVTPVELPESPQFKKSFSSASEVPVMVYENDNARNMVYFASSIKTISEDAEVAFQAMIGNNKQRSVVSLGVRNAVLVECPVQCPKDITRIGGGGSLKVRVRTNTEFSFQTETQFPEFIVFSQNNLPGWKAYVDGEEVPIYTVGSVYMGVSVPKGVHEIEFRFTYRAIIDEFIKDIRTKLNSVL